MFARCTCLIGRPKASAIASSTRLSFNPMRRSPVMILTMYFDPRGSARRSSSSSTKRFCKGPRRALNCSNAACKTCNESSAAGGGHSFLWDWKTSSVVAPKSPCLRYRASRLPASCPVRRLTASQIKEPPTPKIRSSRRGKGRPVKNRAASAACSTGIERRYSPTSRTFSFFLVVLATASQASAKPRMLAPELRFRRDQDSSEARGESAVLSGNAAFVFSRKLAQAIGSAHSTRAVPAPCNPL